MKQQTLAIGADQTIENYRKPARCDEFLNTMEVIVPWSALSEVIEHHDPKAGNGRPPIGLERMLRIHYLTCSKEMSSASTVTQPMPARKI